MAGLFVFGGLITNLFASFCKYPTVDDRLSAFAYGTTLILIGIILIIKGEKGEKNDGQK